MNVFIGVLIGFMLGAIVTCLVSNFLIQHEAFKADAEDKLKKAQKDIRALEDRERENEVRQMKLNSRYDKRIKQAEEAIATLNRAVLMKEKGRHEAVKEEGGEK